MVTMSKAVIVEKIEAKTMLIHMKVCDAFYCAIMDGNGDQIGNDYEGYVPEFMPEDHYGDYLILKIDLDTGRITNWNVPTSEQLEKLCQEE